MSKHWAVACNENPVPVLVPATVQLFPPASGPEVFTCTLLPIRINPPPVAESPGSQDAVEVRGLVVSISPKST